MSGSYCCFLTHIQDSQETDCCSCPYGGGWVPPQGMTQKSVWGLRRQRQGSQELMWDRERGGRAVITRLAARKAAEGPSLFLSMIKNPNKAIKDLFKTYGITRDGFLSALSTVRGNQRVTSDNPEQSLDNLTITGIKTLIQSSKNKTEWWGWWKLIVLRTLRCKYM